MTTAQEPASYREIAAHAGVAISMVHRVVHAACPSWVTGKRSFPPDLADLLITTLASCTLDTTTARKLAEDPDAVLEGAEALAELARRVKAEQKRARGQARRAA